jgi:hypothetical protein
MLNLSWGESEQHSQQCHAFAVGVRADKMKPFDGDWGACTSMHRVVSGAIEATEAVAAS